MSRKRQRARRLQAVALAVGAIAVSASARFALDVPVLDLVPTYAAPATSYPEEEAPDREALLLAAFDDRLWPTPQNDEPEAVVAKPAPRPAITLVLLGIGNEATPAGNTVKTAALYDPEVARVRLVSAGSLIGGYTVESVGATEVVLAHSDGNRILRIETAASRLEEHR